MMPVRVAWYGSVITFTIAIDVRGWLDTNERIARDMALLSRPWEWKHGGYHYFNKPSYDSSIIRKLPKLPPMFTDNSARISIPLKSSSSDTALSPHRITNPIISQSSHYSAQQIHPHVVRDADEYPRHIAYARCPSSSHLSTHTAPHRNSHPFYWIEYSFHGHGVFVVHKLSHPSSLNYVTEASLGNILRCR